METSIENLLEFEDFSTFGVTPDNDETPKDEVEPTTDPVDETSDDQDDDGDNQPPPDPSGDEGADSSPSTFAYLKSNGLLRVPDDFDFEADDAATKAAEMTRDAYREEALQAIWAALPEDFQSALRYGLSGGSSLKEYLEEFAPAYDSLATDTVDNQRKVMYHYYKATSKYTDERINKMIDRLEDSDALQEAAEESLIELKDLQNEKMEALKNQNEAARIAAKEESEKLINNINTEITKIEDTAKRSKVKGFFFNELQFEDGRRASEFDDVIRTIRSTPSHLVQLGQFLVDTYDKKKGFSFDKYIKQGKTQANQSIKSLLDQKIDPKSKTKSATSESKTTTGVNLQDFFNY